MFYVCVMAITSYEDFQIVSIIIRNNNMYASNSVPKMICSTQSPIDIVYSHGLLEQVGVYVQYAHVMIY